MNALYLLANLKAIDMARVVTTESNHVAVALLSQPNGDQCALVAFNDPYLKEHLKGHLLLAKEVLGIS